MCKTHRQWQLQHFWWHGKVRAGNGTAASIVEWIAAAFTIVCTSMHGWDAVYREWNDFHVDAANVKNKERYKNASNIIFHRFGCAVNEKQITLCGADCSAGLVNECKRVRVHDGFINILLI